MLQGFKGRTCTIEKIVKRKASPFGLAKYMLTPLVYSISEKKSNTQIKPTTAPRVEGEGKFGPRKNYVKIPNSIIQNPLLSGQEKMVLIVFRFHAREKNVCYPNIKTICAEAGVSRKNLQKILRTLESQKYVERHARHGHASLYRLSSFGD
jgi:hypothetical protein